MRALYVRTSTDDNDGAAQLHELRAWCAAQGWREVREYVDKGESGCKDSRPQWDILREDVRRGRVREMAVTELSRLGRSVLNVVLALDDIYRAGCRVVLLRQGLDYATPVGRAVAAILVAVAQLERDQIRERVRSGVRRAKEEGTRSGKPIGRPRIEVSEAAASDARERNKNGCSWAQLAREKGVAETTLRRAAMARQKPTEKERGKCQQKDAFCAAKFNAP
jgi:putative DNA-invertase from lambdoid prophage Rac